VPLFEQADIAVMGFRPVIARLPLLLRRMEDAAKGVVAFAPDLLLTIDAPDFSLRVAKKVRARAPAIPIVHWVCPSVWAWRSGRARAMAPHIDRILALLPFEPAALERLHGPKTVYVGHPLMERLAELRPDADEAAMRASVERPSILILPGSRRSEINHLMPVFGEAVARIAPLRPARISSCRRSAISSGMITEPPRTGRSGRRSSRVKPPSSRHFAGLVRRWRHRVL
jgi:lipid-A-disaccharide synthase